MKYRIIFLLIIAQLALRSQDLIDLRFGTAQSLEVATWNVERFPKRGQQSVDSVFNAMQGLAIDVWGLQEISDVAKLKEVASRLGSYKIAYPSSSFRGLAYLYNASVIKNVNLYRIFESGMYSRPFPRRPLVFEFDFKDERYVVINNHFKCCGNGSLDLSNPNDEEARRLSASQLLKQYIDSVYKNKNVVLLGDLNDILTDSRSNNVFQDYLDDANQYKFVDMPIARGNSTTWSYPSWPSHLDHILINKPLFKALENSQSKVSCIAVDENVTGGWSSYDYLITDHRPVAMKLYYGPVKDTTTQGGQTSVGFSTKKMPVKIYPNPSKGRVTIDLPEEWNQKSIRLKVYDVLGQLKYNQLIPANREVELNRSVIGSALVFVSLYHSSWSGEEELIHMEKLYLRME